MNFTESQKNAIDVRDCSLIISAGAGSGKTAVLTERILERICDENDNCNIDDFLIVTFTNAAAKELSDRIRKKLTERAESEPGNKKILNNIALLPLAKISTINSFCYELCRNNFQKIGLSASVRIADEAEMALIRDRIVNELVDDLFEEQGDDEAFLTAYEIFSSAKNDRGFTEVIGDIDRRLRCLVNPEGFCSDTLSMYEEITECSEFFDTRMGKVLRERTRKDAEKAISVFEKLCLECGKYPALVDKYLPSIECELELARNVLYALDKGYESVKAVYESAEKVAFKAIRGFEDVRLQTLIKEAKSKASGNLRDMLEKRFSCSSELLKLAAKDTMGVLSKLFDIVFEFQKRVDEKKKSLCVVEFSDCERYALALLVESEEPFTSTPLAKQLSERFKEVYIDEYQDVNPLQDMIFRAISRRTPGGEEYSRFMVGDIKQSIYRFRGASSDIFMHYRDVFSDADTDAPSRRIFMSDNFRCSSAVIDFTNLIFEKLMSGYFLEGDKLIHSRIENKLVTHKVKYLAYDYDKDEAGGLASPELEAAIIAREIKKIVNNPEYTDSDGKMYSLSDVAVLTSTSAPLKVYESVFSSFGIACRSSTGESFYGKKEILLCLNILNAIDNPERDIYLAGFMRSFAGGFSDDELAIIKKKNTKMPLYRSLTLYAKEGEDEALCEKCGEFLEKLSQYRLYSRGKSAHKLIWKLFCDMDLLNKCSSDTFTKDKKGTRRNLLKLYQMAMDFSSTSFKGAGAFIEYINGSMEKDDIKSEREMSGEKVSLMTIHASKGLEFPVCFVSDLGKKFNTSEESARFVFSERVGAALTLCDTAFTHSVSSDTGMIKYSTPYRAFIAEDIDEQLIDEEIRVLYVALTRARDILYMTGKFTKKLDKAMTDAIVCDYMNDYSSCSSFFTFLLASLAKENALSPLYDAAEIDFCPEKHESDDVLECFYISCKEAAEEYERQSGRIVSDDEEYETEEIDEALLASLKRAAFDIPDIPDIPSKITVSQLKIGLLDDEMITSDEVTKITEEKEEPLPKFVKGAAEPTSAEKGTAMHMFMQFCDFSLCENNGCEGEADRLFEEGFIDRTQRDILDINKLDRFFASDFFKRIKKSKNVYREQRFNLYIDSFGTAQSGDILVQGVIDLFFENDDGTYTLVDFKTDRVFGDDAGDILVERHKDQLMYYKKAVEEITECEVKNTYIYSFSLMKAIEL